ncbi:CBS domain-containing protein [Candidatus Pacearchaeota archaeon]|nr:CBS domain-containing protein [Candidatus Pacearchaeota archaeon]
MKIKEIMIKPEVIGPEATIKDAAEIMNKLHIGSLIVIENSKVAGIITDGDIVRRFAPMDEPASQVKVKEIMSRKLIISDPNESVEYASHLMVEKNIKHLPIIDKNKLIGILTSTMILKHAPEIGMDALF